MGLRIVVAAAAGKMGRAVVAALSAEPDLQLHAAIGRPQAPYLGQDAGTLAGVQSLGVPVGDDLDKALPGADVLIEFSPAEVALQHLRLAAARSCPVVLGSTGFTATGEAEIQRLAAQTALLLAPNLSVGVNVLLAFLPKIVAALGPDYDIEIFEAHHRAKRDAPSGTALALGKAAAAGRQRELGELACFDRNGIASPRQSGSIGFATFRAADVVGEHTIWLAGQGERLELTHRAGSRQNFAQGALRAARWLAARPAGRYDMQDVLGLR
ncbi:MAG: 4-hydroxy-tetrahydrodipicolinate reductase [Acidithiobacillus sp.]|nr:4-hydroxy-tetrahydrodipicolinate reductase [Acidithiobacillus sp.]